MTDSTNEYLTPEQPETPQPQVRDFEDLTLAELLRAFIRSPRQTWSALAFVIAPVRRERIAAPPMQVTIPETFTQPQAPLQRRAELRDLPRTLLRLGGYVVAILIALWSNYSYVATPQGLRFGLPNVPFNGTLLLLAFLLVIGVEVIANFPALRSWYERRGDPQPLPFKPQMGIVEARLPLLALALVFAAGAFFFNSGNRFTFFGILAWVLSILLTIFALAPRDWQFFASIRERAARLAAFPREDPATFFTLLLIMGIASFIRLQNLDVMLPEMTSDHVEKLLDAQQVSNGELPVFMEQNGGRDIAHFYLLALADKIPGVDLNFMTLKILSALEGIVTIPLFYALGREIIGERDRRLGKIVGIAFALVGAIAYWHIQLSRIALRIALTPIVASLLLIYLTRAVRYNRRADFIKAGLVLGFGLYAYQAVRMMPLVVIAAVVLAILFNARNWRITRAYLLNFVALVITAFVVFVPLFRYSVQYPQYFWSRTTGRLLGEDFVSTINAAGQTITREASFSDRLEAFVGNIGILSQNMVNALKMFNYRGDIIFLHNAPDYPHLDPFLGAFLIVGLAGWVVWMVRRREAVDWLVPVAILIMLLPSAFAIAAPNENPSATRASGALPLVLFLVAFGVASVYTLLTHLIPREFRRIAGTLGAAVLVGLVFNHTSWVIFEPYRYVYFQSWHPGSQAGDIMQGFTESGGSYGNTWILRYQYWWDYRAIAIEAGLRPGTWQNGDIPIVQLPERLRDARSSPMYPLDANKDLLFFYHREDAEAEARFREWFPQGYSTTYEVYLPSLDNEAQRPDNRFPEKDFKTYRVPALGEEGFNQFLRSQGVIQ
jgi:hypothetical protein